ncbi:serine/threonine protein kinase [Streptomyces sp. SID6648]|nr:serine/threonine protein kinase [Streptomyces sp. SID6648]
MGRPYLILARLAAESDQPVPERVFIGRSTDGDRTFLVRRPLPGADPARWAIEAEGARRLSTAGFLPGEEVGVTGACPGARHRTSPAISLPEALRAHGGPLPEPAVRALAAALAGTLATAHAHGVTHAGLPPAAVLLTAEGPRLSCFGAVRAAAPDSELRSGLPGLDSGSLAPEQASGGRPRPLGDVYALGAVLARASTGHTAPESAETMHARIATDPASRTRFRLETDAARVIGPVHGARVFDADPHAETP